MKPLALDTADRREGSSAADAVSLTPPRCDDSVLISPVRFDLKHPSQANDIVPWRDIVRGEGLKYVEAEKALVVLLSGRYPLGRVR